MFSIQRKVASREELAVINNAHKVGETWELLNEPKIGTIPVGTVEYCLKVFRNHESPDFYPKFLTDYLCRHVLLVHITGYNHFSSPTFVKDASNYKSDFVAGVRSEFMLKNGSYWLSDVVNFIQEWRYYVAKGELITTGWYSGDDENEIAPTLNIDWPKDFSGAVDFGRLDTGEIALVESHPAFACGWYGEDGLDYVRWLQNSWKETV